MLLTEAVVRDTTEAILAAHGASTGHARIQADLLIDAELRGIKSHGLMRLPRIVRRIVSGLTRPLQTGTQTWLADNFLSVDGQRGLGPVVAMSALEPIALRARQTGIAIAAIHNNNHLGALSFYGEHLARRGLVLIAMTISEALVHPHGGRQALVGTNPIMIAVPAEPFPFVVDMATSIVSMGKIHDYAAQNLSIPKDWALDRNGHATTDAVAAKDGSIAPFGGAKGYVLGLAVEVIVGALSQSAIGTDVKGTLDDNFPCNKGDIFIAVSPPRCPDAISSYLAEVRSSAPQELDRPVRIPGERAQRAREKHRANGLDIDDSLWKELLSLRHAQSNHIQGVHQ